MRHHVLALFIAFTASTFNVHANTQELLSVSIAQVAFQENAVNISFSVINKSSENIRFSTTDFKKALYGLTIKIGGDVFVAQPFDPNIRFSLPPLKERFSTVLSPLQKEEFSVQCHKFIAVDVTKDCPLTRDGDYVLNGSCSVADMEACGTYSWNVFGSGRAKIKGKPTTSILAP